MSTLIQMDPKKSLFDKTKKARILRQKKTWEAIQQAPEEEWAFLINEEWPDRLPNYIIDHAPFEVIEHCFYLKQKDIGANLFEMEANFLLNNISEEEERAIFRKLRENAWPDHGSKVEEMMGFLQSLTNATVTITTRHYPLMVMVEAMGSVENFHDELELSLEEKKELISEATTTYGFQLNESKEETEFLECVLCLCLADRGGIQIRSQLPLKVMRVDEQGAKQWKHQEKVYGFTAGWGELTPLNAKELKHAYETDYETGEPLPVDLGVHFGDTVKDFAFFQKSFKKDR